MTQRICPKCNQQKEEDQFSWKELGKKRQTTCKECTRLYCKTHYKNNKKGYLARARISNKKYIKRNRAFIWSYLINHPCEACGEKNPILLEFHHRDKKEFNISFGINQQVSIKRLSAEIQKCQVLCANCHRLETTKEEGWWKLDFEQA